MLEIILPLVCSIGLSLFLTNQIIKLANQKNLFDIPEGRKQHKRAVPALGGLAIFVSMLLCNLVFPSALWGGQFKFIVAAFIILVVIGLKDDLTGLRPKHKLLFQFFAAQLVFFSGLGLNQLSIILLGVELSYFLDYTLTTLFICVVINSFNLIDGVDGLASSLGLIGGAAFGFLFLLYGNILWSALAFSFAGSLIGFLRYNFRNAKIFLGDNGSMLIGIMLSCFCLQVLNEYKTADMFLFGYSLILIPVLDLIRVFSARLIKGKSPFLGDRTHLHHLLLRLGWTSQTICIRLMALTSILFIINFTYKTLPTLMIMTLQFMVVVVAFYSIITAIKSKQITRPNSTLSFQN